MNVKFVRLLETGVDNINLALGAKTVVDSIGRKAVMFDGDWALRHVIEKNPGIKLTEVK